MFDKILDYIFNKPLSALGFFLFIPFPMIYSFGSGIFDHWPWNSSVLASVGFLGMIIWYFGDKYENGKDKDK